MVKKKGISEKRSGKQAALALEKRVTERVYSLTDFELRSQAKDHGLKPGPINDKTRSSWQKRLITKELAQLQTGESGELANGISKNIPEKDAFGFSTDDDTVEPDPIFVSSSRSKKTILTNLLTNDEDSAHAEFEMRIERGDDGFSDKDDETDEPDKDQDKKPEAEEEAKEQDGVEIEVVEENGDSTEMKIDDSVDSVEPEVEHLKNQILKDLEEGETDAEVTGSKRGTEEPGNASERNSDSDDVEKKSCLMQTTKDYLSTNRRPILSLTLLMLLVYTLFLSTNPLSSKFQAFLSPLCTSLSSYLLLLKSSLLSIFLSLQAFSQSVLEALTTLPAQIMEEISFHVQTLYKFFAPGPAIQPTEAEELLQELVHHDEH